MRREGSFRKTAKQQLDDSIHAGRSLAARHAGALLAYERLLWQVQTRTNLLHPSDRAGRQPQPAQRRPAGPGLAPRRLAAARRDVVPVETEPPGRCSRLWRTTCSPGTPSRLS